MCTILKIVRTPAVKRSFILRGQFQVSLAANYSKNLKVESISSKTSVSRSFSGGSGGIGTDGSTNVNLTTATDCTNLPIGSLLAKIETASETLKAESSAEPFILENTSYKDPKVKTIIGADNTGTTTIQFYSDDSAGNKDGKIHFHCKWYPISGDGFLTPA